MKCRPWVIVLALALAAARAAAAADALALLHERGTLRWGGDIQGGEPYAFQDPQDSTKLLGFEVEIAAVLARRLGVRAEFVQNDWLTLIPSLERGDFDMILNGLEVTAARRARVAFTRPYYAFSETLVARRSEASIHGLTDLGGRRVGTLGGSLAFDLLRNTPGVEVIVYEGVEEPYLDLEHGRLAAVLLDNIIANRYGLVRPSLRAAATVADGLYAIAVRRDQPALLQAIDSALEGMRRDGELRAILERWNLWNDRQAALVSGALPAVEPVSNSGVSLSQIFMFLRATGFTVAISSLAMAVAVAGGLLLSLARRYGGRPLRALVATYIEVFRGTPVLLQLYVLYYGLASVWPLNAFSAAVAGLGLNYAAYEAELYRAGLEAVPIGQTEAALSLGMSRGLALRRIVLPQALRVALPGIANDFIALLKDSSLVSVITVVELTKQMTITAVDVRSWFLPGLLCAGLYLALSYPLSRLARRLERRMTPAPT
jgi:polar amino acid transport system permease protein/polar amino acid transport system substrate-binding protein